MHSVVVDQYTGMLRNMLIWLEKAQSLADATPFDSANYLEMRLAPDMLPFASQVVISSELAKQGVTRLLGIENQKAEHDDSTLQGLSQRVHVAIDYLDTFSAERVNAAPDIQIFVPRRGQESLTFSPEDFVLRWSDPNFFFHVTMTYALLRYAGVSLGKADYLGIY